MGNIYISLKIKKFTFAIKNKKILFYFIEIKKYKNLIKMVFYYLLIYIKFF